MKLNTKSNNKLKIGRSVSVNRWLLLGFVAVVVASAIVIVRYSGASGPVYSAYSSQVTTNGGTVRTKNDGSHYWVGKSGNSVDLNLAITGSGTYCVDGAYGSKNSSAAFGYPSSPSARTVSGSSGTFTTCVTPPASNKSVTLSVKSGNIVFYRFRKTSSY